MEKDAKTVLSSEHMLGNRMLEVKVATSKEEMRQPMRKVIRISVARIPSSVTESAFRSHFEEFGEITDLYMPKDRATKANRGIGFITFSSSDSVDNLMNETHELGGSAVVVDRATPKEDDFRPISRVPQGGYGAYNAYISAETRYAALGAPTLYDHSGSFYGRGDHDSVHGMGRKIYVGRLPQEATADDLRHYFGRFGRILDACVPKRSGQRGFGFVTFVDDGVTERVSRRSHEICGVPTTRECRNRFCYPPLDNAGVGPSHVMSNPVLEPFMDYLGPMRSYSRMYANLGYPHWGYGLGGGRPARADIRDGPY